MTCSRLTIKAQEAALATVSLVFVSGFEHVVVYLIFLLRDNLFNVFSKDKRISLFI